MQSLIEQPGRVIDPAQVVAVLSPWSRMNLGWRDAVVDADNGRVVARLDQEVRRRPAVVPQVPDRRARQDRRGECLMSDVLNSPEWIAACEAQVERSRARVEEIRRRLAFAEQELADDELGLARIKARAAEAATAGQ